MSSPLDRSLQGATKRYALPVVTLLFIALSIWLLRLDLELRNDAAPNGIVSFELARTAERSGAILASWDAGAREAAMLIQGLDYLYLLVYSAFLSLLCWRLADPLAAPWRGAGMAIGNAVWLCAPFDAVENQALIAQIMHGASDALAGRAFYAALPKFFFFTLAVAFILVAGSVAVMRRGGRAV